MPRPGCVASGRGCESHTVAYFLGCQPAKAVVEPQQICEDKSDKTRINITAKYHIFVTKKYNTLVTSNIIILLRSFVGNDPGAYVIPLASVHQSSTYYPANVPGVYLFLSLKYVSFSSGISEHISILVGCVAQ